MQRFYYALDLQNDAEAIAEYERWHQPGTIWPDIVASIRAAGIEEMEIFRTGNRLVMAVQMRDGHVPFSQRAEAASDARTQDWEALMDRYQQRLPWAEPGQKWVPMARIFSLQACLAAL